MSTGMIYYRYYYCTDCTGMIMRRQICRSFWSAPKRADSDLINTCTGDCRWRLLLFYIRCSAKKNITLRGKKADGSEKVEAGDRVVLFLSDETIGKKKEKRDDQALSKETEEIRKAYRTLQPLLGDSPVLYEDDNILIVRKPAGILSQKAAAQDISMNEWLRGYLLERQGVSGRQEQQEKEREIFRPSVCNRLDRNTGGILLCACSLQGSRALSAVIRGRALRKTYRMVVHGRVEEPGMVDTDLIKDHSSNQVRTAAKPADTAEKQKQGLRDKESLRSAVTVYRPVHAGRKCTMVEADLITGRSHQLRVHMASIGHPIVFDPRYGDRKLDLSLAQTIPAIQTIPAKQTASAKQAVPAHPAIMAAARTAAVFLVKPIRAHDVPQSVFRRLNEHLAFTCAEPMFTNAVLPANSENHLLRRVALSTFYSGNSSGGNSKAFSES